MPIYECRYRNEYGDEIGFEVPAVNLKNASIEAKRRLGGREFRLVVKEEELVVLEGETVSMEEPLKR